MKFGALKDRLLGQNPLDKIPLGQNPPRQNPPGQKPPDKIPPLYSIYNIPLPPKF